METQTTPETEPNLTVPTNLLFDTIPELLKPHIAENIEIKTILDSINKIISKEIETRYIPFYKRLFIKKTYYKIDKKNKILYFGKPKIKDKNITIYGPAIIGAGCELRSSAFIRGNVIIGNNCVIGNSTELKNSILFDNVEVPHFNYVGDSILGYKAHLGAGVKISNVLLQKDKEENSNLKPVSVKFLAKVYKKICSKKDSVQVQAAECKKKGPEKKDKYIWAETGMEKLGAIIGDYTEVGCNSVLNPGTILEKKSFVPPLSCVGGYFTTGYKITRNIEYMSAAAL